MAKQVTIVMYHYVRGQEPVCYPIFSEYSIDKQELVRQIDFFEKHYKIISAVELLAAIKGEQELPENALLLTFDDGYGEHYKNVFPILKSRGISGCFFPCAKPVLEGKMLNTNKVQFLLTLESNMYKLEKEILHMARQYLATYPVEARNVYEKIFIVNKRTIEDQRAFIKRLLMRALPQDIRENIILKLCSRYFYTTEECYAKDLYMNKEQLQHMVKCGMYIGCHSFSHSYMDSLESHSVERELSSSLEMLRSIGSDMEDWIMCYPCGSYSEEVICTLQRMGCKAALATSRGIANIETDNPFILPRIDCSNFLK